MTKSFGKLVFMAVLSLVCLNIAAAPAATVAGIALEPAGQSGIVAGTAARETDKTAVSRSLPRKLLDELLRAPPNVVQARSATRLDRDLRQTPPDGQMRESLNRLGRSGCYFDPVGNDDGPRVCAGSCQQASDCGPRCFTCGFFNGTERPGRCIF